MKKMQLLPVFLFLALSVNAQVDTAWTRLWDSQYWDEAHAITTDDSNNVYVAGWSLEWGTNYDFIFSKYNSDGNLQWTKIKNYASDDQASHILYDHQGNIYIGGFVYGTFGTVGGSICLMKYTTNGDSIWEFVDNHTYVAQVKSMKFDNQGNIILAGYEKTSGSNSSDYVTMKIDATGNQHWYETYTNNAPNDIDNLWDMCVDADNYIYVTGESVSKIHSNREIASIKYNPNGDTVWVKRVIGSSDTSSCGKKIVVDQDKNVFVGGYITTQTPLGSDIVLIKYDSSSSLIWKKYYDYQPATMSNDILVDMKMDNAGNIYITGTSSSTSSTSTQRILTIKYNANGDTLWTRRWGTSGVKYPQQLAIDNMANIYSAGSYWSTSGTGYDAIILKYDSFGMLKWEAKYNYGTNLEQGFYALTVDGNNDIVAAGRTQTANTIDFLIVKYLNGTTGFRPIENGNSKLLIDCYPNPFTNTTFINFNLPAITEASLKVFDLIGNEVRVLIEGKLQAGNHRLQFNADGLKAGIYFLRLANNNNQLTRKIVIQ